MAVGCGRCASELVEGESIRALGVPLGMKEHWCRRCAKQVRNGGGVVLPGTSIDQEGGILLAVRADCTEEFFCRQCNTKVRVLRKFLADREKITCLECGQKTKTLTIHSDKTYRESNWDMCPHCETLQATDVVDFMPGKQFKCDKCDRESDFQEVSDYGTTALIAETEFYVDSLLGKRGGYAGYREHYDRAYFPINDYSLFRLNHQFKSDVILGVFRETANELVPHLLSEINNPTHVDSQSDTDPNYWVRSSICLLGYIGPCIGSDAIATLTELVSNEHLWLDALTALTSIRDQSYEEIELIKCVGEENVPRVIKYINRKLRSGTWHDSEGAINFIGCFGSKSATQSIIVLARVNDGSFPNPFSPERQAIRRLKSEMNDTIDVGIIVDEVESDICELLKQCEDPDFADLRIERLEHYLAVHGTVISKSLLSDVLSVCARGIRTNVWTHPGGDDFIEPYVSGTKPVGTALLRAVAHYQLEYHDPAKPWWKFW